jgi:hypothetical protein
MKEQSIVESARGLDLRALAALAGNDVAAPVEVGTPAGAEMLAQARRIYRERRERDTIFGARLFADPVWDLLLDLFIAEEEGRQVSVSSACLAAAVPNTTALRYIQHMAATGLLVRRAHPADRRSTYLLLTASTRAKMIDFFTRTALT